MLNVVKSDLKSNYYDPTFRGMDLETRFKTAEEKIKAATSGSGVWDYRAGIVGSKRFSHHVLSSSAPGKHNLRLADANDWR